MATENKITQMLVDEWSKKGEYLINDVEIKRILSYFTDSINVVEVTDPPSSKIMRDIFLEKNQKPTPMLSHEKRIWEVHTANLEQGVLAQARQLDLFSLRSDIDEKYQIIPQDRPEFFSGGDMNFFIQPYFNVTNQEKYQSGSLTIAVHIKDNLDRWLVRQGILADQSFTLFTPLSAQLIIMKNSYAKKHQLFTFGAYPNLLGIEAGIDADKPIDDMQITTPQQDPYTRLFFWQLDKFIGQNQ